MRPQNQLKFGPVHKKKVTEKFFRRSAAVEGRQWRKDKEKKVAAIKATIKNIAEADSPRSGALIPYYEVDFKPNSTP